MVGLSVGTAMTN